LLALLQMLLQVLSSLTSLPALGRYTLLFPLGTKSAAWPLTLVLPLALVRLLVPSLNLAETELSLTLPRIELFSASSSQSSLTHPSTELQPLSSSLTPLDVATSPGGGTALGEAGPDLPAPAVRSWGWHAEGAGSEDSATPLVHCSSATISAAVLEAIAARSRPRTA
jgi:hypothetical protein